MRQNETEAETKTETEETGTSIFFSIRTFICVCIFPHSFTIMLLGCFAGVIFFLIRVVVLFWKQEEGPAA